MSEPLRGSKQCFVYCGPERCDCGVQVVDELPPPLDPETFVELGKWLERSKLRVETHVYFAGPRKGDLVIRIGGIDVARCNCDPGDETGA